MKRIRYFKDKKNNRLVSKPLQSSTTPARYIVRLYPDDMRFEIVNTGNGSIVKRGQSKCKDIRYLKERVRRIIQKSRLGINLVNEVRRVNND